MKTKIHLSLLAIVFIVLSSCQKSNLGHNGQEEHVLNSQIAHFTNDPVEMVLGHVDDIVNTGDHMTLYLPYEADDQNSIQDATITVKDANTGEIIDEFRMLPYTDPSAANLNLPTGLSDTKFMFVGIDLDNNYTGRIISLSSTLVSDFKNSTDVMNPAFSVQ